MVGSRHHGYILRGTITGLYKVGITGNIKGRLGAYRTHTPERIIQESIKDFLSHEEAKDWESYLLWKYRSAKEHGEWLRLDFDEMSAACQIGTEYALIDEVHGKTILISQEQEDDGHQLVRVFGFESPGAGRSCADLSEYLFSMSREAKIDILRNAPRVIPRDLMLALIGEKMVFDGSI